MLGEQYFPKKHKWYFDLQVFLKRVFTLYNIAFFVWLLEESTMYRTLYKVCSLGKRAWSGKTIFPERSRSVGLVLSLFLSLSSVKKHNCSSFSSVFGLVLRSLQFPPPSVYLSLGGALTNPYHPLYSYRSRHSFPWREPHNSEKQGAKWRALY